MKTTTTSKKRGKSHRKTQRQGGGYKVYEFDEFERLCLPYHVYRPSCDHTVEIHNLIRFRNLKDYLHHLSLLHKYNSKHNINPKRQRDKNMQFLLRYVLQYMNKHETSDAAKDDFKFLQVLHPYYYISLVEKSYVLNSETSRLLKRSKNWIRELHLPSSGGGLLSWIRRHRAASVPTTDVVVVSVEQLLTNVLDWVYLRNNELWTLHKPSDLIRLLQSASYSMKNNSVHNTKSTGYSNICHRQIVDVKTLPPGHRRWKDDVCWDVTFSVTQSLNTFNHISDDLQNYNEFGTDYLRSLCTAVYHEKKVCFHSNVSKGFFLDDILQIMFCLHKFDGAPAGAGGNYTANDIHKFYLQDLHRKFQRDSTFHVRRLLELRGFSTGANFFDDIFYDRFYLGHDDNQDVFGIFSQYHTLGMKNPAQKTTNLRVLVIQDSDIRETVNQFLKKHIPEYAHKELEEFVKDGRYMNQCYMSDDSVIYVAPQHMEGRGFKVFLVAIFSNIFETNIDDVKFMGHCLLLWDNENDDDDDSSMGDVYRECVLNPVYANLQSQPNSIFVDLGTKKPQASALASSPTASALASSPASESEARRASVTARFVGARSTNKDNWRISSTEKSKAASSPR